MVFAEFQILSTGWNEKDFSGPKTAVPMLGSDGCYILDARQNTKNHIIAARRRIAAMKNIHGGIIGFKLFTGQSFTNCKPLLDGKMIPAVQS